MLNVLEHPQARHSERTSPYAFARLYIFIALPLLLVLNFAFPAFHAPDDNDHVKRASTLITGQFRPTTIVGKSSGALIDSGLSDYIDASRPVFMIETRPLTPAQKASYTRADQIHWSGKLTFSEAPGSMSYFPLLYSPQALMLALGRGLGATVANSVLLARLANSLAGMMLVALGLRMLPLGHALVLVTMLLPKSLLEFASNSADPILFGTAVILTALAIRTWQAVKIPARTASWAGPLLVVVAAVRPPLIGLTLPFYLSALRRRSWRTIAFLSALVFAVIVWFAITEPAITDLRCGHMGSMVAKLASFAIRWPLLVGASIVRHFKYYVMSFIGELGWGDGPAGIIGKRLPVVIYLLGLVALGLAAIYDRTSPAGRAAGLRLTLLATSAVMTLLVFFAMYVACTEPLRNTIGGVQGRYFVPSLLVLAPALAAPNGRSLRLPGPLLVVALAIWSAINLGSLCLGAYGLYWRL